MMNIVITGGLGFIGFNFLLSALEDKLINKIVVIDKVTYASQYKLGKKLDLIEKNNQRVELITEDINEVDFYSLCKSNDVNTIVNFAAESHVDNAIHNSTPFLSANISGLNNILQGMIKIKKAGDHHLELIQISTDEVFGHLMETDRAFTETSPLKPRNPYSATKAAAELLIGSYKSTFDLHTIILNCCNNFGPYQHPEKLIPKSISRFLSGEKIPIYGDGSNIREWIFVEDFCEGIKSVLKTKNHTLTRYLFGSGIELSNLDLMKAIHDSMGFDDTYRKPFTEWIDYVSDRLGHDKRYAVDSSLTKTRLNWKPKNSFSEGVDKTIQFYKGDAS